MEHEVEAGNGTELEEAAGLDARGAAQIMAEAQSRAERELRVNLPALYLIWGLLTLVTYGVLWLSVRHQSPYHGPSGSVFLISLVLLPVSVLARVGIVGRAGRGVSGRSVRQWIIFFVALPLGAAALWVETDALYHAGISRPVLGVLEFATPMLAGGLVFFVSSAMNLEWSRLFLGAWLLGVGAGGAWAGPETMLAVDALAGCGGFVLAAALEQRLRRS